MLWIFPAFAFALLLLAGCEGSAGAPGAAGAPSATGSQGPQGDPGGQGPAGQSGGNVQLANFHGTATLLSTGAFATGKSFVKAEITSATADADGTVTVNFTVKDSGGNPVSTLTGASFNIVKLAPKSGGEGFNKWVPYIYNAQTVSGSATGDWPNPDGTAADQGTSENNGTFTNNGDGSYSYLFAKNISNVVTPVTQQAITYDRSLTHRVTVMMGGSSGPTADAFYDFVPDGAAVIETRNIISTSTCQQCHGWEFRGHGGNRLSVEVCVTCHNPSTTDPHSGETVDFKVMIHKIHAGGELASIPGPDGKVWDDPATVTNEAADNGSYAIWGYRNTKHEWWEVEFPAVIENCTKCHQGTGENVDNWKNVPSRAACGSCHDNVNFATGINHAGGAQTSDGFCAICHQTNGLAPSATEAHNWTTHDPRNIPEFDVNLTLDVPARGYYIAGESPVVSIVINKDGAPIDHTTVAEDGTAEGCLDTGCPPEDGLFRAASLFVHGPRALRVPVLTTAARAAVLSATAGPFDISAAGASLILKVDQGEEIISAANGGSRLAGTITVNVSAAAFASTAAATTDEMVAWLTANAAFKARAIAYNQDGRVGIRSRNLGKVFAIQLQDSVVENAVFADEAIHMPTGSTPGNNFAQRTNPANNDPKAVRTADKITYTLDPVDDLEPGTYVATVEIADRGNTSDVNYKTPSVAKTPFQVKTVTEELAVAGNCGLCHQGPEGKGFVLDPRRHNKIFDNTALDQCGSCHDYMPQFADGTGAAGSSIGWSGARPISRRVHAVHFGSSLNYPLLTVDYANGDPIKGRNWEITLPQDVRNCETCHPAGTTSGSWKTEPARLPCMGCHDSDAATAHMKLQTFDPTPALPWSGDEKESCKACH